MTPRSTLRRSAVVLAFMAFGCSNGGSAGCTGMTPLTSPYAGTKSDNAINMQVSPEGVAWLNQPANAQALLTMFAPGGNLSFRLPCGKFNVPVLGDVYIADNGSPGDRQDEKCAVGEGRDISLHINAVRLAPAQPDIVNVELDVEVVTGKIYLAKSCIECSIDFNTTRANPRANTLGAKVKFSVDAKWDKLLTFDIVGLDGTKICGANGALAKPRCMDPSDLDLSSDCAPGKGVIDSATCATCSVACSAADWDPIKDFVLGLLSDPLQNILNDQLKGQGCRPCGTGLPSCPSGSACRAEVCTDTVTNKCVPRFLGVEGQLGLGTLMAAFGAPANAKLNMSVAAGSSFSVDSVKAINVGSRAGMQAPTVSSCVPPVAAPAMLPVSPPNFRAEAPPVSASNPAYHVAVGISQPFLGLTFHEAQQSGAFCIALDSSTVGLVNTGLFKTFLPSLGKIAGRDGKDAPMMVVLKPAKPPTVKVGEGSFDPMTKKPLKPLLTLTMTDLSIDLYAMIDERFARLFTITVDISLPLSLIFNGCSSIEPALGDLKMLVTNVRTSNSEMLAEDPKALADLLPAVIGFAEPAIASALKPFGLPPLGSFKLKVNAAKGVGKIAGTETYNHLGLYATLLPASSSCAVSAPRTTASLKRTFVPPAEQMRLRGEPLPLPVAVLEVQAFGATGDAEFSWRVNGGFWSAFAPASAEHELVVSTGAFLMQGHHTIEVRSRDALEPNGIGDPTTVNFDIDWEPPEVALRIDRLNDRIEVTAHDVITPDEQLEFSYRVGTEGFSDFGPARDIVWSAVEQQGGVTVRVRDQQGNVGEKSWRVATSVEPTVSGVEQQPGGEAAGCTSALGGGAVALAGVLGLLRRRRSARAS